MEVHGRAKQGAAFGYTKVRGYHPQLATCPQTGQVLMSRFRGDSAGAARGAASFLTETISRVRNAGATGRLTVRAVTARTPRTPADDLGRDAARVIRLAQVLSDRALDRVLANNLRRHHPEEAAARTA